MRIIFLACVFLLGSIAPGLAAPDKRVALVIGQNGYANFQSLENPFWDARGMGELLAANGFEVISCDGKIPGCFDLDREGLLAALSKLETRAAGAGLALVYYAGHGAATEEGNMLAPTDADVNCQTGAIAQGVPVERLIQATRPARHKFLILDACRDNPLRKICPGLAGKKLSFTRIEAGAMQGLLLVTSTQFGQQALDGLPALGAHSPFATALLAALKANPNVYFEQLMNEVARATFDEAQKIEPGYLQIPGKVVGGAAPADCLAGKDCIGDARMAALAAENGRLLTEAAGTRNILAKEEADRGKPYTFEERKVRVAALEATLASIGKSTDPLKQEARRLINEGDVAGGEAKLDEAGDAEEKEAAELERMQAEKLKAAARTFRERAVLARGRDVAKAVSYLRRATHDDPDDAQTWEDLAEAAVEAGRSDEAKAAFEQASLKASGEGADEIRFWAANGSGDIALAQGSLPEALRLYRSAQEKIAQLSVRSPDNSGWQRDLSVSYNKVGDVLVAQGNLPEALKSFQGSLNIRDRLAKADPNNAGWQRDLSVSYEKVGDVLVAQGNLPEALKSFQGSLDIRDRLAKADPNNAGWQRDLSVSYEKVGDVLVAQGNLPEALKSFQGSLDIRDRLAKADPNNAGWQRDLSVSYNKVGDVLVAQGNLPEALKSYHDSLAIVGRLAKADPNNAGWQRDLSVSYNKVGDVLVAQGNLPEALKSFQGGLDIADRLAKADPNNAGWQRDLSVSYNKVGDVLVAQGNLPEALKSFQGSLNIRDRLAKADPNNAGWQRDLSVSYDRVGDVLVAQGNLPEALKSFQGSLDIADRLAKADPNNAGWQRDLSVSYEKVGDVLVAQGNLPEALKSFQGSLNIRDRLAKADPNNAGWQRDLAVSNERLGDMFAKEGKVSDAIAAFERALSIYETLTTRLGDPQARVNSVVPLWRLGGMKGKAGQAELRRALGILVELRDAGRLDAERVTWIPEIEGQIAALETSPYQQAKAAVEAAFEAKDFDKAVALQAKLAAAMEKAEREKAGKPGPDTAAALLDLSWYRLFDRDFRGALAASDRAIAIEPERIVYATNKAHALMFLGRGRAARALYLRHKGQRLGKDGKLWEAAILDDFKEFEKRGLKNRQMGEIEALLAGK